MKSQYPEDAQTRRHLAALATSIADLKRRTEAGLGACDHEMFGVHQRLNACEVLCVGMDERIDACFRRLDRAMLEEEEAYQRRQEALKALALVLLFVAGVLAGVLFS